MAHGSPNGVSELEKAAGHRREDAQALFDAGRWRGAMYVGGYAVECLLKTKLMKKYRCRNLEELEKELQRRGKLAGAATVFTHQLRPLLEMAGAFGRLRRDPATWARFAVVNQWLPSWRYTADLSNPRDAENFLLSVDVVRRWVANNV